MQEKSKIYMSLDILAMLSLVCAILALGGAVWFTHLMSEALLFKTFHSCLALSIAGFIVSRLVEISSVVSHAPSYKRLRTEVVTNTAIDVRAAIAADTANVITEGKFSRAA